MEMADNKNLNEPKKLTDDELAGVAGGRGWDRYAEERYMDWFLMEKQMGERFGTAHAETFEQYLAQEDPTGWLAKDRQARIDKGRPWGGSVYAD